MKNGKIQNSMVASFGKWLIVRFAGVLCALQTPLSLCGSTPHFLATRNSWFVTLIPFFLSSLDSGQVPGSDSPSAAVRYHINADLFGSFSQVFEAVSQIHDVPFGTYFEVIRVHVSISRTCIAPNWSQHCRFLSSSLSCLVYASWFISRAWILRFSGYMHVWSCTKVCAMGRCMRSGHLWPS